MNNTKIHLGKVISDKTAEKERNLNWLSKKLNYDRSNLDKLLEKDGFHTDWLINFSAILQENMAKPLSDYIDNHIIGKNSPEK
ncbi:MAG: hypothetical protein LBN95_11695 [Prevotellaceae bacterium]|nr:hypothetical protein [Prevotellaceae bacterium]